MLSPVGGVCGIGGVADFERLLAAGGPIALAADKIDRVLNATARNWGRKFLLNGVVVAGVLLVCPWLWQSARDAYIGYSGVVVDKGNYMWIPFRGPDWYIVLEDSQGHRTRRYVNAYGYAYSDIGSYVVKKRGLGEYPRRPGDLTPREFEQLARRKQNPK